MIVFRMVITISLLLLLNHPARAAIRPSFQLDASSWNATHIVVVATTAIDGQFNVLESLKGDLQSRASVFVPELVPPINGAPIPLLKHDWPLYYGTDIPRQPVGSRMVLFLKQLSPTSSSDLQRVETRWGPTNVEESSIKASVIWIEVDTLYKFCQPINPGPSVLCEWSRYYDKSFKPPIRSMSEAILRHRTAEVIRIQEAFNEALLLQDSSERAARLVPFVRSDVFSARVEALKLLPGCSQPALPAIRAALDDVAFEEQWAELVRIYGEIGRRRVEADLASYLEREGDYWLAAGSSLPIGWESQIDRPPSWHYSTTVQLITSLSKSNTGSSLAAICRVCSLWPLAPRPGFGGTVQITEECQKANLKRDLTSQPKRTPTNF